MSASRWQPKHWGVRTFEQAVAMIEAFTGQQLTRDELAELEEIFRDEDHEPREVQ